MTETGITYDAERRAEADELQNVLVAYQRASAEERQKRDLLIATWRDHIHNFLKQSGYGDPRTLHLVLDNMDEFLNRAGGRRK